MSVATQPSCVAGIHAKLLTCSSRSLSVTNRAPLRSGLHEPLGLKDQQCLPDWRAADREIGGEPLFPQGLARMEPPFEDGLPDQLSRDVGGVANDARGHRTWEENVP
jgi:hypothetical protein